MIYLKSMKDYILSLNEKELLRSIGLYFLLLSCTVCFLLYRHYDMIGQAQQKIKILNKSRQDVQLILTEYDTIKNKKVEVDDKLIKDKNFYLVKFFQDTIAALNIPNANNPNLVSGPGPVGYTQESLAVVFTQITMQNVCEFLQKLQATPRVTVKNLEITKANVDKKINANMSLITLKPIVDKINSTK